MNTISHRTFKKRFRDGNVGLVFDTSVVGNFIASSFALRKYRIVYKFYGYTCMFFMTIGSFIMYFYFGIWLALLVFIIGVVFLGLSQKLAKYLAIENMLSDEDFFNYIQLHNGAKVIDNDGKILLSEFLDKMQKKHEE